MTWPDQPTKDDMCLHCGIAKRKRHSWFCRIECEDKYIEVEQSIQECLNVYKETDI